MRASHHHIHRIAPPSPAVTDRDGCTPLYCAAAWNRIEAVRLLEQLHCPSSLRSLEGRTAVHVAAEQVGWGRALLRWRAAGQAGCALRMAGDVPGREWHVVPEQPLMCATCSLARPGQALRQLPPSPPGQAHPPRAKIPTPCPLLAPFSHPFPKFSPSSPPLFPPRAGWSS